MNKYLTISASTVLLFVGLLSITGCSSSDDGGSGGAVVPSDAVLINDSATAEETLIAAIGTGELITSAFGVEASTPLTAKDIIDIVFDKVKGSDQNSPDVAIGVDLSSDICMTGTASGDESETDTSYSASITFNACEVSYDLFFTGSLTLSSTWSNETSDYTDNASGNLTVTYNNDSIGFNGFNFAKNGNQSSGDYTITTFTYAIDPSTGGGFTGQLTQPLVGNDYVSCGVTSGQVLVTGAEGSQARATFNTDGSAKSEYHSGDGNFIETDNSPLSCLIY